MSAVNPYGSVAALSETESLLLWEYAKLASHLRQLATATRQLADHPDNVLARLRILERKMALVLTLYKASVWGVINEQNM